MGETESAAVRPASSTRSTWLAVVAGTASRLAESMGLACSAEGIASGAHRGAGGDHFLRRRAGSEASRPCNNHEALAAIVGHAPAEQLPAGSTDDAEVEVSQRLVARRSRGHADLRPTAGHFRQRAGQVAPSQRRDELQELFEGRLTFATGCDFHLSFENLHEIRHNPERFTLNQKNYLLVEFADFSIPPSLDQALHDLQLAGLRPIITHPERNPLIRSQPERLFQWLRQGCYAQVTAQSLLGRFGKAAQAMAEEWLDAGAVHFIASDAHNATSRPLMLKEAFDHLTKTRSEDLANALLVENPLAAFEGSPIPYVPELAEKSGMDGFGATRRRKRFWFF